MLNFANSQSTDNPLANYCRGHSCAETVWQPFVRYHTVRGRMVFCEGKSLKKRESKDDVVFPTRSLREAYTGRFPKAAVQRLEAIFTLRSVSQQVTNVLNNWLEGTAGSPARFQALAVLWGAGGRQVPYQEIIAALQVKRASVSALMFSLEQDGLVRSTGDPKDRRRLLATLTKKGEHVITSAMELNAGRLEQALGDISAEEFSLLVHLLARVRDGFHPSGDEDADA